MRPLTGLPEWRPKLFCDRVHSSARGRAPPGKMALETDMRLMFALVCCVATCAAHADVYRYVDRDGTVKYTDKPETLPAELLAKIKSQRTDNADVADRVAADLQARDAATAQSQADAAKQADAKKAALNTAEDKAERCTKARERYDNVMNAQKLYTTNESGEREYMDSAQIDQTRASAKQMMDTWCN